jgi:hypothetical protein
MEIELVPLNTGKPILRIRIPPNPQMEDEEEDTPFVDIFRTTLMEFLGCM